MQYTAKDGKGRGARSLSGYFENPIIRLLVYVLVILVIASSQKASVFWSSNNLKSMMIQMPEFGILSLCYALCLCLGGNDLSAVSVANFTAVISAMLLKNVFPQDSSGLASALYIILALLAALAVGGAVGVINGLLISRVGIPAIIATLGTQEVFMGLTTVLTKDGAISSASAKLANLGSLHLFNFVPLLMVVFIAAVLLVSLAVSLTSFGYKLFMVGSNRTAADYSGMNTSRVITSVHGLSGMLAGLAGFVMLARNNSANANYGTSYMIQCILIAIMGGTEGEGGYTNILGVFIGVLIVQCISSTLNIYRFSSFYKDLIFGLILLFVLMVNLLIARRRRTH